MTKPQVAIDFASHTNTGARALYAAGNLGQAVSTAIDKTMAFYDMHTGVKAAFFKTLFNTAPTTKFDVKQNPTGFIVDIVVPRMGGIFERNFSIGIDYGQGSPVGKNLSLTFGKDFDENGFRDADKIDAVVGRIHHAFDFLPALSIKANQIHGAAISDVLKELIRDPNSNPADFFKAKPADPAPQRHP